MRISDWSSDVCSSDLICRSQFALPPDNERLSVLNMDVLDYVTDFSRRRSIDILQVDLYDAQAKGPLLSTNAFYAACASCLTANGMMTVNLYCDWPEHQIGRASCRERVCQEG